MDNIISRMVAPFLLIIGLFFLPILNLSLQNDGTKTLMIENAVWEFVDNARSSGKIEKMDYEKLMQEILAIRPLCEVHITHDRESFLLEADGFYSYFDAIGEDEILRKLYETNMDEQPYLMKKGDRLQVIVQGKAPGFGRRLLGLFLPKALVGEEILAVYGGYVEENGCPIMIY